MSEQAGFDPNSEQAKNSERKGAEKDFSTQLQERLQALFESGRSRPNKTNGSYYAEEVIDGVLTHILSDNFSTALGDIYIAAQTDSERDGQYLADDKKRAQYVKVWVNDHSDSQFEYTRGISEGSISETFLPKDIGAAPDLTREEEKLAAASIRLTTPDDLAELDDSNKEIGEKDTPYTDTDTDLFSNVELPNDEEADVHGGRLTKPRKFNYYVQHDGGWAMFSTYNDAWDDARRTLQLKLAYERYDSSMNPERQKKVLDALDAALLTTELEAA